MKLIGRPGSRYATESYPTGPGGGGGGGSGAPLSRQRFIDGGTSVAGGNGAAAAPFATIAAFIASRTNASVNDATANYVGWLTPTISGYAEAINFPPYASTELRADSLALLLGTSITGNATWANVAGANAATVANLALHNIVLNGNVTITDDAGAPPSNFIFTGDELAGNSAILAGDIDSTGATHLVGIFFNNASITGSILGGATALSIVNGVLGGAGKTVTVGALGAQNSTISCSFLTLTNGGTFSNCQFLNSPLLTSNLVCNFDGVSWANFVGNGGTRAAGTAVLVVGGYNGAPVEGAALPIGAGPTNVSLNGTGATAGYTGGDSGNSYSSSGLTADSVVKLLTGGGEKDGDTMLITKADTAAQTLTVQRNAGTTIGVIPSGSRGFILARYSAAAGDWLLAQCGSLAA